MSYSNYRPELPINSKGLFLPIDSKRLFEQDQTLSLSGMKWEDYEQITKNSNGDRIFYSEEMITTVYPNRSHQVIEQTISILINAYCRKYHKLYFPMGSSTIRFPPCNTTNQPNIFYAFDTAKSRPELSIEILFNSGGTANTGEYHRNDGYREVWLWQNEQIKFYQWVLDDDYRDAYLETEFSRCLKNLSSEFLIEFINRGLTESPLTIEADFVSRLNSN